MQVTINPVTTKLFELAKKHGASGWVVLNNLKSCPQRDNKAASLVIKDNKMIWLTMDEIK